MLGTSAALFAAEAPMLYFILIHILLCSYKVLGSVALSGNSCLVQVDTFSCNFCEMNSTTSKKTPQPYQECFVECPVHLRPAFALVVAGRGFFYLRCDVPIWCWLSASSCTGSSSLWLQSQFIRPDTPSFFIAYAFWNGLCGAKGQSAALAFFVNQQQRPATSQASCGAKGQSAASAFFANQQ